MKKSLSIEGMTCNHCVMHVTNALMLTNGVDKAEVDLGKKTAIVEGSFLDDGLLESAVAEAGYKVVAIT